jgi:hypothetical protein
VADKRPRMPAPAAVGRLLADTFQGTPLARRLTEAGIWEAWDQVVGASIAAQARPSTIRDGVLTVLVASAPWMQQLNFLKGEIRERLNSHLGADLVQDIYLKAGRPPRSSQTPSLPPIPDRPLSPDELTAITATVASITDDELRTTCQRLLTTHHRRH